MFWFQDSIVFHIVNKQTNKQKKRQNRTKHGFRKLEFSAPFQVRLMSDLVGTSGQELGIV
jgi:hypothetical protein